MCADEANLFFKLSIAQHSIIVTSKTQIDFPANCYLLSTPLLKWLFISVSLIDIGRRVISATLSNLRVFDVNKK
jgi:hypothetical protein